MPQKRLLQTPADELRNMCQLNIQRFSTSKCYMLQNRIMLQNSQDNETTTLCYSITFFRPTRSSLFSYSCSVICITIDRGLDLTNRHLCRHSPVSSFVITNQKRCREGDSLMVGNHTFSLCIVPALTLVVMLSQGARGLDGRMDVTVPNFV